jgi:hypothetical protein
MEPVSDAIVCDSSMRFSGRTFIRMVTRIIEIIFANRLPTIGRKQRFGIIL